MYFVQCCEQVYESSLVLDACSHVLEIIVLEKLFDEIHMGQQHASTAVSFETERVECLTVSRSRKRK